jgi:hypothetical protein
VTVDPGQDGAAGGPFSPRAVLAIILVGVFSFSAFSVLSTYAPELRSGHDGRGHPLSRSADGFGGLVALAREAGLPVRIARGAPPPGARSSLRVLTVEAGGDPAALKKALADKAYAGRTLVILPKWETRPDPRRPGWTQLRPGAAGAMADLTDLTALPEGTLERHKGTDPAVVLKSRSGVLLAPGNYPIGAIRSLTVIAGGDWRPILTDGAGLPVLAESSGDPDLFVLADPDLMNTQGLRSLERARLAIAVLDGLRHGGPVVFDVTLNGFSSARGLLRLAFEPPFLAATLCAAAALLMALHAAVRFGPAAAPQRALALGKRALVDNSAALLRLARREPAMAGPYAELTRRAVARAVGAKASGAGALDKAELDAAIDRMAVRAGRAPQAAALTAEAGRARDVAALMAVARKLYDFRRGMTRERD